MEYIAEIIFSAFTMFIILSIYDFSKRLREKDE